MGRFSPQVLPQPVESPWETVRQSVRSGMQRYQVESDRERQWAIQDRSEARADNYLALQQTINQRAETQRQLENSRYTREQGIRDAAAGVVAHDDSDPVAHSRRVHVDGQTDI